MNTFIQLKPELLEENLMQINTIIESSYPDLTVSEKYQLKLKRMKMVVALTTMFFKEHIDGYFDIVSQQVLDAEEMQMVRENEATAVVR